MFVEESEIFVHLHKSTSNRVSIRNLTFNSRRQKKKVKKQELFYFKTTRISLRQVIFFLLQGIWAMQLRIPLICGACRDGNGAGRGRVSLSHTHSRIKNSSPSPYPNPTGIKLFSHPHPHRVTGIISYPYPYPRSNYFNINFYKRKKITVKKT